MGTNPDLHPSRNSEWWEKVDRLLHSALERPPDERTAFLREACAGDASLFGEIHSLLSAQKQGDDFLENPPFEGALHEIRKPGDLEGIDIGPYHVQSLLGYGGIGEVYKAVDTRLNRALAIKFLSAGEFLETRLHYFEREARLASSLNHPNIVTIYDVGRSEFGPYIGMELVVGRTLRDVLADGPLPLKQVLQVASQIADGLAKAHAAGIFHRDLKPENVMVTADGLVKILDFGLAKLAPSMPGVESAPVGVTPGVESAQIGVTPGARLGGILGTIGYMSPEQAVGRPADFRSDQFSLGAILYEMVTGQRAFKRATSMETLSATIRDEPEPIASLNPQTPEPCRRVIERCLSKRPEERYASTSDLAGDLKNLSDHLLVHPPRDGSTISKLRKLAVACLILAAALVGFWSLTTVPRPNPITSGNAPVSSAPRPITFRTGHVSGARFAPNNAGVIYGAHWEGQDQEIYMTQPGNPEHRPLGPKSAGIFAVSPEGKMAISLPCRLHWGVCTGQLHVAQGSGVPHPIAEHVTSADWSQDGKRLIIGQYFLTGSRISEDPGSRVFENFPRWVWVSDIHALPDNQIAFIEHPLGEIRGSVCVLDADFKEKRCLSTGWKDVAGLAWNPRTKEIWFSGSREGRSKQLQIHAVTLDGKTERVIDHAPTGSRLLDISPDGSQIVIKRESPHAAMMALAPGESKERDFSFGDYSTLVDLSSDGKTILFYEWGNYRGGVYTAFLRRTDESEAQRVGEGKPLALSPKQDWVLALQDTEAGQLVLLHTRKDQQKVLPRGNIVRFSGWAAWTPDGNRIVFSAFEQDGRGRTYIQDIDHGLPEAVTPVGTVGVLLSSDGKWIAGYDQYDEYHLYSVDVDESMPLYEVEQGDVLLQWSGQTIFLRDSREDVLNIYTLNIQSGVRNIWKELSLPNVPGLIGIDAPRIARDAQSYAYTFWTAPGDLFLVEGLQ